MSYILDALKKSDQERQDNQGPTIKTIQRPPRSFANRDSKASMIFVIFLILAFVVAAVYWLYTPPALLSTSSSIKKELAKKPVSQEKTSISLDNSNKIVLQEREVNSLPGESQKKITANRAQNLTPLVEFWELPDHIQQVIPPLTFSFHVYSKNAERRTIIINKHRMSEGDTVLQNLVLEKITKEGVELMWKEQNRFSINVVEKW